MIHYDVLKIENLEIVVVLDAAGIRYVEFSSAKIKSEWIKNEDKCKNAIDQLKAYFAGELKEFDLKLAPVGTEFQQKVWAELTNISYGQTISYKDLAIAVRNPNASRAVGMANSKNPIPIIIPCHRVINQNGNLGGYSGGIKVKKLLLDIENES